MDYLLEMIWDRLDLVRVYTKKRGDYPDFNDPIIILYSLKQIHLRDKAFIQKNITFHVVSLIKK